MEDHDLSDERIGEALIKEVIVEELRVGGEEVPPLTPALDVQTEQEQKVVTQLGTMIRIIGDRLKDDKDFQDAIDGITRGGSCMSERLLLVANKVFEHGEITWERIAVLFYVAGRVAVRMVRDHLPCSVGDILRWMVDYFKRQLLNWIHEHGGWLSSFSALAQLSARRASWLNGHVAALALIFLSGIAVGSLLAWRVNRTS